MFFSITVGFSVSLILFAVATTLTKWKRLDLLDLYVILVGCYFGLYSLGYVLCVDIVPASGKVAALTYLSVLLPLGICWLVVNYFLPKRIKPVIKEELQLANLLTRLQKIPEVFLLSLLTCLLFLKLYFIRQYGFLYGYDATSLQQFGYHSNYLFTSLDSIYYPFLLIGLSAYAAKFFSKQTRVVWKIYHFFALTVIFLLSLFYRREGIFNFVLLVTLAWIVIRCPRLLFWKTAIFLTVIASLVLLLFSVFEAYRYPLIQKEGTQFMGVVRQVTQQKFLNPSSPIQNLLRNMFSLQSGQIYSLSSRPTMWRFNYNIMYAQVVTHVPTKKGLLAYEAIKNTIPKPIFSKKVYVSVPDRTCDEMGISCRGGYDWNYYAFLLADFGKFYVLIMPISLLFFFLSTAYLLRFVKDSPVMYAIFVGFFMNFILWVSQPYESVFLLYRNLSIIMVIYLLLYGASHKIAATFK